jgi:hypothetical protein
MGREALKKTKFTQQIDGPTMWSDENDLHKKPWQFMHDQILGKGGYKIQKVIEAFKRDTIKRIQKQKERSKAMALLQRSAEAETAPSIVVKESPKVKGESFGSTVVIGTMDQSADQRAKGSTTNLSKSSSHLSQRLQTQMGKPYDPNERPDATPRKDPPNTKGKRELTHAIS